MRTNVYRDHVTYNDASVNMTTHLSKNGGECFCGHVWRHVVHHQRRARRRQGVAVALVFWCGGRTEPDEECKIVSDIEDGGGRSCSLEEGEGEVHQLRMHQQRPTQNDLSRSCGVPTESYERKRFITQVVSVHTPTVGWSARLCKPWTPLKSVAVGSLIVHWLDALTSKVMPESGVW